MSDYAIINAEYVKNFGQNPPVRSCVQADVSTQSPLLMTAIGHKTSDGRHVKNVMHVQSVSHWAPANIGPYSQMAEVAVDVCYCKEMSCSAGADSAASLSRNRTWPCIESV
jgi:diphthine-ammonia ligase